jgi:hypothetical protein
VRFVERLDVQPCQRGNVVFMGISDAKWHSVTQREGVGCQVFAATNLRSGVRSVTGRL